MTPQPIGKENEIRVLVVDDHAVVREGLMALIDRQRDMKVIAEAGDGKEAVVKYREHLPDVTLMDLRLPEMNGAEAIAALRREFPESCFIVLTTYDGDEDIYRALQAGASGYLLKDVFREDLLAAIRTAHAGRRCLPPLVAHRLAERLAGNDLTPREADVLQLIARGKSNREIATKLLITEGTVKGHVNNILSKLGVNDRTGAATTAVRRGIVHLDQDG